MKMDTLGRILDFAFFDPWVDPGSIPADFLMGEFLNARDSL